jgi:hypothetical protein
MGDNGSSCKFAALLDTGASVNLISLNRVNKAGLELNTKPIMSNVKSFTRTKIDIESSALVHLDFGDGIIDQQIEMLAYTNEGAYDLLLGFPPMKLLGIGLVLSAKEPYFKVREYCYKRHSHQKDLVSALQGINLDDEIKFEDIDLTFLKGISLQPGDELHVIFKASDGVEGQAYHVELGKAIKNAGVSSAKPFAQLHQVPGLEKGQLGVFVYLEHKSLVMLQVLSCELVCLPEMRVTGLPVPDQIVCRFYQWKFTKVRRWLFKLPMSNALWFVKMIGV